MLFPEFLKNLFLQPNILFKSKKAKKTDKLLNILASHQVLAQQINLEELMINHRPLYEVSVVDSRVLVTELTKLGSFVIR